MDDLEGDLYQKNMKNSTDLDNHSKMLAKFS